MSLLAILTVLVILQINNDNLRNNKITQDKIFTEMQPSTTEMIRNATNVTITNNRLLKYSNEQTRKLTIKNSKNLFIGILMTRYAKAGN